MQKQMTFNLGKEQVTAFYPNVGQKLEIETRKLLYSKGAYGDLSRSLHITGNFMLDIIDAYAYFSVCCPDLKLKKEDFDNLTPELEVMFIQSYKLYFYPWYIDFEQELSKLMMESVDNDGKQTE